FAISTTFELKSFKNKMISYDTELAKGRGVFLTSSLEKDEFNFAYILAHDLLKFPSLECIDLTPQQRLEILKISLRLTNRGIAKSEDLAAIANLLSEAKANRLQQNATLKARLETDFVNS
ncbi:MAG: hypothetical protein AAFQ41_07250, partial [Cyanobacteria bacterium J06623_7]